MSVALEVVPTLNMAPMGLEPSAIASMVSEVQLTAATDEQYKIKVHDWEGAGIFVRRQPQIAPEYS